MRAKPVKPGPDGDFAVYAPLGSERSDRIPLLDLRTRLVLWILCLVFFGLIYFGLQSVSL